MKLLQLFRNFQSVLGICPCCGELFRLSDAQVFIGHAPPRTIFDHLDEEEQRLNAATERFEGREANIRERARTKGRAVARRQLRALVPVFGANQIDLEDVKVIFDPVEYVAFCGHSNGTGCSRVQFVSRVPATRRRERAVKSLERTLKRGNVEWRTLRVLDNGEVAADP